MDANILITLIICITIMSSIASFLLFSLKLEKIKQNKALHDAEAENQKKLIDLQYQLKEAKSKVNKQYEI